MGATTKSGRTRNRRSIAKNAPPGGWPLFAIATGIVFNIGGTIAIQLLNLNGTLLGSEFYDAMSVPDTVTFIRRRAGVTTEVTATIVQDHASFEFTPASASLAGDVYILKPWQQGFRGPNGEWIAPFSAS